jgi:hypothetical protein
MPNEGVAYPYIYEPTSILTHGPLGLLAIAAVFSTVPVGNQIDAPMFVKHSFSGNFSRFALFAEGRTRQGGAALNEGRLLSGQCDTRSHVVSGCVDWRTS